MNKSINIKEEILNSFRENYEQKDGEWGYHGWVEETGFGEVYEFLSNSLDRMESEVREEMRITKEEYMLFEHMERAWLAQTTKQTNKDWFDLFNSLSIKIRNLKEKPKA